MKKLKKRDIGIIVGFFLIIVLSIVYKYVARGDFNKKFEIIRSEEVSESSLITTETEYTSSYDTGDASNDTPVSFSNTSEQGGEEVVSDIVHIYICGAVINPGIYTSNSGCYLYEIIDMAGGLTEDAPVEYINMVYSFTTDESVYIPFATEDLSSFRSDIIRQEYTDFVTDSSGTVNNASGDFADNTSDTAGLVNINTASREELMTLPGIGEVTAGAIIAYREVSAFNTIEDIMNVSGIGEEKFNRIRELICV